MFSGVKRSGNYRVVRGGTRLKRLGATSYYQFIEAIDDKWLRQLDNTQRTESIDFVPLIDDVYEDGKPDVPVTLSELFIDPINHTIGEPT